MDNEPVFLNYTKERADALNRMVENPQGIADSVDYPKDGEQKIVGETAEQTPSVSASAETGTFDVKVENGVMQCFDSSNAESTIAGILHFGYVYAYIPKTELSYLNGGYVYVYLDRNPQSGTYSYGIGYATTLPQYSNTFWYERIARTAENTAYRIRPLGDITVLGRYL